MLKRVIEGYNAAPGAPAGWNPERDGDCSALPIRVHPPEALTGAARLQWCESAWEPTPRELDAISRGRSIILRVVGWQVPVALYVDDVVGDAGPGATWLLRYDGPASDETFSGDNAETVARLRFDHQRKSFDCALFREVVRG